MKTSKEKIRYILQFLLDAGENPKSGSRKCEVKDGSRPERYMSKRLIN